MALVDGGELFARSLKNGGVEQAFVLCGGHTMPIFYGMRDEGIDIIDVRHECAAMHAAIAYARASGKVPVVVTTAGPGVANTPAGMMEAEGQGVPIIHIGGAVSMGERDGGGSQDMETLHVMERCSKWARKITDPARIPEYVANAFRHAMDSTPGPVYLEIPVDVVHARVEEEKIAFPVNFRSEAIPCGDAGTVDAAATLLANAERPALIIDNGARFSLGDDARAVTELSDYLKMPINVWGHACRGFFGDESGNPLVKSYTDNPGRTRATGKADVVLAMGCRFDFRLGGGRMIPGDAKVIQVHTDTKQIGFNLRADIAIAGATGPVANQILEAVKALGDKKEGDPWTGPVEKGHISLSDPRYAAEGIPIHPGRLAGEVAKFFDEEGRDWNFVSDGAEASNWIVGAVRVHRPAQLQASGWGPSGAIGLGPCLVVGAWAANRKPVLWHTGDGSFGFYAMEMDTMARLGIPVVCVISNDSGWGMIRLQQKGSKRVEEKGHCNVDLHHMRAYEKMAEMWGGHGEMVTDPAEIIPAIKRAVANGKPSIINVEVDREIAI